MTFPNEDALNGGGLTAIVLAAGLSRRAAPANKLLLSAPDGRGRTVVRATVEAVVAAGCGEVLVVTGHECEKVEAALAGLPVRFVFAPDFMAGMGHSLATGVRAARADTMGFVVVPGDLPWLTPAIITSVLDCFESERAEFHVVPMVRGARGHPVVLGAWLRPALEQLAGDAGARHLLASPAEQARCCMIELGDEAILRDVDLGVERPYRR